MTYSITKKTVSAQPVLVRRFRVAPTEIPRAFGEGLESVFAHAKRHGIALTGRPFARYPEMSGGRMTIEPGMRIEASDAANAESEGEVRVDTLPGGTVASTVHEGAYQSLGQAHTAIRAWIEEHGLTPSGAPWEVYVTDPMATPDQADWRTEVCWPVE
jgi:AraC family transcriptional regulator